MHFIHVLLTLSMYQVNAKLGCKDLQGNDVDWFAAIKLPTEVDRARKGRSFVYFDARQNGWTLSPKLISNNASAIGATLSQLYGIDMNTTFAIAYNDDNPDGKADSYRAHSKGVAVFGPEIGFWMLHSVPNFPPTGSYAYPPSGSIYGQSFLCLSLSVNVLEDVGQYMRYANVVPYLTNLPKFHQIVAPSLVDVIRKKSLPPSTMVVTTVRRIQTLGGKHVKVFSKHKKFGADLWYDFIGLNFGAAMSVETWRNGNAEKIGSSCSGTRRKPNIYDIASVKLLDKEFPYSKDHSKWGVSMNASVPVVCIGDINRQVPQYKRGGGAVCIEDVNLWVTFSKSVAKFNECKVKLF